jgi:AsmA protein
VKFLKILGATFAGVIALLVVAALLIAWLFDPNDYKDYLADYVERNTGRELRIEQDLELSFFPWLAVETGGITVGNAAGFDTGPFATVDRVEIRVKLLPLLRRQFEIGTVILDGLVLNLARDAQGNGNWQDLIERGPADEAAAADSGGVELESLDIEGFRIRNSQFAWHENSTELKYHLAVSDLQTGPIAIGAPIDLALAIEAREVETERTVRLSGSATAQLDVDGTFAARAVDLAFSLSDREHPRRAEGTLRLASFAQSADGTMTLGAASLNGTARALPGAPPELALGTSFSAAVVGPGGETLRIDELVTEFDGIRAAWELNVEGPLDQAVVAGTVAIADAPLGRVFALLDMPLPAGVTPASLGNATLDAAFSYDSAAERLSMTALDGTALGAALRGELTVEQFNRIQGRVEIPELAPGAALLAFIEPQLPDGINVRAFERIAVAARIDTDLNAGRSSVRDLRATLLGATVSGEVDIAPSGRGQSIRGTVRTTRFAPEAFQNAFGALLPQALRPGELGMLALDTRFALDTGADTLALDPLQIEAFGLQGSGRVNGRAISGQAVWAGNAEVREFSPRDLLNRFAQLAPDTSDPTVLTRATASAGFEVTAERGRFENIVLALDDSRITGNLTVDGFDDPGYLFALAIDRVDADRYLPPRADAVEAGEMTAGDLELEVDALNVLKLSGTIEVGALALAGMQFQQVATRMEVGGGRARLEDSRAQLYGGEFQGSFGVDITGPVPRMTLSGRASGLGMRPIIVALTGDANLSGTGNFELNLAGSGPKVIDNVRSASGNLGFTLADGAIEGFNLGRGLCVAYNVVQRAPAPPSDVPRETRFMVIQGTAEVRDGVAHMSDLLGRASFMEVNGSGRLVLAEQHLDYQLEARLSAPVDIPNCETMAALVGQSIPLRVRGPVTDPEIAPDYSAIIERQLRREAERRITDRLQDLIRR